MQGWGRFIAGRATGAGSASHKFALVTDPVSTHPSVRIGAHYPFILEVFKSHKDPLIVLSEFIF